MYFHACQMLIRLKYLYWDSIDCSRCLLVPDKEGEANDMNGLRILYADETLRGIYVCVCIYIYIYTYIQIDWCTHLCQSLYAHTTWNYTEKQKTDGQRARIGTVPHNHVAFCQCEMTKTLAKYPDPCAMTISMDSWTKKFCNLAWGGSKSQRRVRSWIVS